MGVRTIYELRVLFQVDGSGDFAAPALRFDELQFDSAQQRFTERVRRAKTEVGKPRGFVTADGNPYTATPKAICVELWQYKSGRSEDGASWASRPSIVGENVEKGEPGMREVLESEEHHSGGRTSLPISHAQAQGRSVSPEVPA